MATVLLDAYDSFTFNLYQYLRKAGAADVQVFRNDKITLAEVIALNPRNIVLSPGPGHPLEDPGICYEVLAHFAGKVPILGICLGQQMICEHYGMPVGHAGEIQHGKTGLVAHDGRGVYRGVAQHFPVTRYHSLAADPRSLPGCLEITSWTANGVVMGVRHRTLAIEGVQYHPESILSENGLAMFRNFLALQAGTWDANPGVCDQPAAHAYPGLMLDAAGSIVPSSEAARTAASAASAAEEDILARIFAQRQRDVAAQKALPGRSLAALERLLRIDDMAAEPLDFAQKLRAHQASRGVAVLAEVKRASPSKGDISPDAIAAEHALAYAHADAAAISVLTEPTWFKGSLDDLRDVCRALVPLGSQRPAVLRKEFVFDPYQIAEARLAGADTVLLIVKMLSQERLAELMRYSRNLGMEPLVEVNTKEEMRVALEAGAKVIGINNRDLRSFRVDVGTSRELAPEDLPEDTVLIALSGIMQPADAEVYRGSSVRAVLVGEGLMRAQDKAAFVRALQATHSE
ncbi:anthranilate synthase / indole-3-glycerol phosphate synthase [Coemansia interrupta]|uniref:Anthranilate synthase component 2 n=1 Tax=Coemansia interrupta TaxID=1126814 RepID=A0A9W8LFX0_9FUNG|nr:anthranilate synthase / indole-3-glycerol phosphate synthase [Coemansia interrupta]